MNTVKIEKYLREIVEPVLESARKDIRKAGYKCEVEIVSTRDPDVSGDGQTFALHLIITTARDGISQPVWLRYKGESDGVTLKLIECYGNMAIVTDKGILPLSTYSQTNVEQQVEAFVKIIFKYDMRTSNLRDRPLRFVPISSNMLPLVVTCCQV